MIKLAFWLLEIRSIKHLKLVFLVGYINFLVLVAYVHLLRYSESFTQAVNASSLNQEALNEISDLRGLQKEDESKNRKELENLILSSGKIYNSEITNAHLAHDQIEQKVFNSAGELLESIEDSRDSVWLVHIVMNNDNTDNSHLKIVPKQTWKPLAKLSKFNILTGTFNCAKDPFFCQIKGWSKPQLVLSIVKYNYHTKSNMVKLYKLSDYAYNSFENVTKWLKDTLKTILISEIESTKTIASLKINNNNNDELKIFYKQISKLSKHIPFFYTAISIKYNHRAKFYYLENTETIPNIINCKCKSLNQKNSNTPIYLVIDNKICYNYGTNLNELPNYTNMNMFLMFLYPDLNSMFLVSFYLLNSFIIMVFFEYNESFMRLLARGVFYLCICNFILISIWLVQNANSTEITFLNSVSARFFVWYRYIIMSNSLSQRIIAHVRFILYYHIYIQSSTAILSYIVLLILFYMQTKRIYNENKYYQVKNNDAANLKKDLKQLEDNINRADNLTNHLQMNISSSSQPEANGNTLTNSGFATQPLALDSDMEISIHELISQINGPTSIWLQSSTHADRLILELPHIEYCKCFYARTVKLHACDETDIEDLTDRGETEDDEKSKVCECGRNKELNKYLDQNYDLNVKFRRECSICLEKYTYCSIMVMLPCGHSFHRQCIYEWFMNSVNYKLSCPMCRTSFYKNKKII